MGKGIRRVGEGRRKWKGREGGRGRGRGRKEGRGRGRENGEEGRAIRRGGGSEIKKREVGRRVGKGKEK